MADEITIVPASRPEFEAALDGISPGLGFAAMIAAGKASAGGVRAGARGLRESAG